MPARTSAYLFGPFRLETAERRLLRGGVPIPLTPKMFETLRFLVERRGQALSKAELMEAVWPDAIVEEANLTVTISALRKALQCRPEGRYIETVNRYGYRFAAEVREAVEPPPRPGDAPQPGAEQVRSLAVLPFTLLGAGEDEGALGLGLADALISRLGTLGHLAVRPTSAVSRFRGLESDPTTVAGMLRVDALVHGTIQRAGGRTRVRVQLVDGRAGTTRWAGTFDEASSDVLQLQESMAQQIAAVLVPTLTDAQRERLARRHSKDPEAYQLYMQGRDFWSRWAPPALCQAIRCFEGAIARDPEFALAYAGIADACAVLGFEGAIAPDAAWPKARAAALKAIDLDPALAEAHVALGTARFLYEWNAEEAGVQYRLALTLDPRSPVAWHMYATYLYTLGRIEDAAAAMARAEDLDPISPIIKTMLGFQHFLLRHRDEDVRRCRRIVALYPDYPVGHVALGLAHDSVGEHAQAIGEHARAVEISGRATMMTALLARSHALAGGAGEAWALLDELAARSEYEYVSDYLVALVHGALGDADRAFEHLERALAARDGWLVWINVDPRLDQLNGARLEEFRDRVGLPRP